MVRDYERVARQLERVISALDEASRNNRVISIAKACEIAGIHQAWLYRILNNIEDYKINDDLLERLEEARDRVISVIIQRIDRIGDGSDDEGSDQDSLNSLSNKESVDTSAKSRDDSDSATRIARDTLRLKKELWKLKNLLPKHFGDQPSNQITINDHSNNRYSLLIGNMNQQQLKVLAGIKLIDHRTNEDE